MSASTEASNETRWQRTNRLGGASLAVLKEDKRLLVFPLVSAFVNLSIGAGSFALSDKAVGGARHTKLLLVLGGVIASYPATFTGIFCGVALAAMLAGKLSGEPVSVREAWALARRRTGLILMWTAIACTIGAVLKLIEEYLPIGGKIAGFALDISWSLATLFAVPVIAYEGLSPRQTLRRSTRLFRERWGEQVAGLVGVSLIGGMLAIIPIVLIIAGTSTGGPSAVLLVALGGGLLLAIEAFTIALGYVYRVYLYQSTLTPGVTLAGPFRPGDLSDPFKPQKQHWYS